MMKIALAALASLAAFVFLPFPTAFLITSVVVLAALFCTGESNLLTRASAAVKGLACFGGDKSKPAAPAQPAAPAASTPPVVSNEPTEIIMTNREADGEPKVRLFFHTPQIRDEFIAQHKATFKGCFMIAGNKSEVVIWNKTWKGIPRQFILTLQSIFPQNAIINAILDPI